MQSSYIKTSFERQLESCPQIIKKFLNYTSTIKGKEKLTIKTYYFSLKGFFEYMLKVKGFSPADCEKPSLDLVSIELINNITQTDIYEYFYYRKNEFNDSAATRGKDLAAIKMYFKYMYTHEKIIEQNPAAEIDTPKKKKKEPKYLTDEQSLALLKSVSGSFKERDYCILVFFLNLGIRLSELKNINFKDIRTDNSLLIHGKGNKERTLYLNNACVQAYNQYIETRPVDGVKDKEAVFLSRQKNRLSERAIENIVYKYLAKIGLDGQGYSCHKLRHTYASKAVKEGKDIRTVQMIMGHENIATTEKYTHIRNTQIESAMNDIEFSADSIV